MAYVAKKVRSRWVCDTPGRPQRVPKGTPGARLVRKKSADYYGFWYEEAEGGGRPRKRSVHFRNCRDKDAARARLNEHLMSLARRRAGLEYEPPTAAATPIRGHLAAYLAHLRGLGRASRYVAEVERQVDKVLAGAGADTPAGLDADRVRSFLETMQGTLPGGKGPGPMSARTRETHRQAVCFFTAWLADPQEHKGRPPLAADPLAGIPRFEGEAVRRRRALDVAELQKLLDAARERPLHNALYVGRGRRLLDKPAGLPPEQVERLRRAGTGRALLYKMAVLVLARFGALRQLRVDCVFLDAAVPHVVFTAATTKGRRVVEKPLPPDLAADLRAWLALTGKAGADPVFDVPAQITREFRKDLAHAGVVYRDGAGRTVDLHALKRSGVTAMVRAGLDVGLLQAHAEHRDSRVTLGHYHDALARPADELFRSFPKLR